MKTSFNVSRWLASAQILTAALCLTSQSANAAASIVIVNGNAAGVGFNDPTPVAPIGGNTGTTLGQQRLIAFQHAATLWGATLDSAVPIKILATFEALGCTASSAVLGSAGAIEIFSGFPGAEFPDTWYCSALANRRAGFDLSTAQPDIRARFNVNLGNAGCLTGVGWYLGLDSNHGNNIDLVTVLLHEFGHGLGFQTFASTASGAEILGLTDIYGRHLLDLTTGKTWDQMSDAERVASAINTRQLAWNGASVTAAVPSVLGGTPILEVNSPPGIAGFYQVGTASFGPALTSPGITAGIVVGLDPSDGAGASTTDGCSPLDNVAAVAGKIVLLDRGSCAFVVKVKNAQNAGAIGVIIANITADPTLGMTGSDPTITIPSVRITQADGSTIKTALLSSAVNATLGLDPSIRAGADAANRALMYTPNPREAGSSVSHWDPTASPNQLMEPAINADLTHSVSTPQDLTASLMRDLGWFPDWGHTSYDYNDDGCVNLADYNILIGAIRARSTNTIYDLNFDGKVDIADARLLAVHFSRPGGSACP